MTAGAGMAPWQGRPAGALAGPLAQGQAAALVHGEKQVDNGFVVLLQLPLKAVLDHSLGQFQKCQRGPSLGQSCLTHRLSPNSVPGTRRSARDTTGKKRCLT